ncbi:MAG: BatA and WFA domain-containing protein [Phycisphaerales bacterium]|nr:BatA and WFA domain-containing protein [Phycisphaerales bacterium]
MTFLAPFSALVAAIVAGTILVALYMLRLLRPTVRVPSTLLWLQKRQDVEANAPFQRLHWSVLLFIQLLIAACLVLALGQPVTSGSLEVAGRTVLLVDQTASMNMVGSDGLTRLDHAKRKAIQLVRDVLGQSSTGNNQVMVVGVASQPQILTGFQSNLAVVERAIENLEPTDESANIREAMELAANITQGSSDQDDAPGVVFISDGVGARPGLDGIDTDILASAKVHWIPIDDGLEANIGIVSFSARRDHRDPAEIRLLAQVTNSSDQPIENTVIFEVVSGQLAGEMLIEPLSLPGATSEGPGKAVVAGRMQMASAGVLTASLGTEIGLSADNQASVVIEALKLPKVVVITPDEQAPDAFLIAMLEALVPGGWEQWKFSTYETKMANLGRSIDGAEAQPIWSGSDLIIFDGIAEEIDLEKIPVDSITFKPAANDASTGRRLISWDRTNPLLQHVAMDDLVFVPGEPISKKDQLKVIADGRDGPVIAVTQQDLRKHLIVGFQLSQSTWPLQPGGIVFMQNALDLQVGGGAGAQARSYQPGEMAQIKWPSRAKSLQLNDTTTMQLPPLKNKMTTTQLPQMAGLYEVTDSTGAAVQGTSSQRYLALNLASPTESDLRRVPRVDVGGRLVAAGGPVQGLHALWPWLVAAAFLLLSIEWLVYMAQRRSA